MSELEFKYFLLYLGINLNGDYISFYLFTSRVDMGIIIFNN